MGYIGNCPTDSTNGNGSGTMEFYTTNSCTGWNFSNGGKVGIGSAAPTVALDVVGEGKFTSSVNLAGGATVGGGTAFKCIRHGTAVTTNGATSNIKEKRIDFSPAFTNTAPTVIVTVDYGGNGYLLTVLVHNRSTTGFDVKIIPNGSFNGDIYFQWLAIGGS
jgi:hypothetical protein